MMLYRQEERYRVAGKRVEGSWDEGVQGMAPQGLMPHGPTKRHNFFDGTPAWPSD